MPYSTRRHILNPATVTCIHSALPGNNFINNTAAVSGGAIFVSYCGARRPSFPKNKFDGNGAKDFPGQIGVNAMVVPVAELPSFSSVPKGAGCLNPDLTGSVFLGKFPKLSPPW